MTNPETPAETPALPIPANADAVIVQLDPENSPAWLGGLFMAVSGAFAWGAEGVVTMLMSGGSVQTYWRAPAGSFEPLGVVAEAEPITAGDVLWLDPAHHEGWRGGQLMVVTEPKSWGAQGYVATLAENEDASIEGEHNLAYYRAKSGTFTRMGRATWVMDEGAENGG